VEEHERAQDRVDGRVADWEGEGVALDGGGAGVATARSISMDASKATTRAAGAASRID
jgi:hypothetical protein